MIKLIRLDERMIHGQIAIKWSRHTGVDRIIVANDAAAANPIVQKSLMMAAPPTAKVAIKSVDASIEMLKNPKAASHSILLIVASPEDLLKMVKNVEGIPLINVGNYGRIAPKENDVPRHAYASNLYAYPSEVEIFKQILDCGIETVYQTTPEDVPENLNSVLGI